MKHLLISLLTTITLFADPQAVIFDWGNVISFDDRSVVVNFMCESFQITPAEFEEANLKKRAAIQQGTPETDFWLSYAEQRKIHLPENWPQEYTATIKRSVGADPKMLRPYRRTKIPPPPSRPTL